MKPKILLAVSLGFFLILIIAAQAAVDVENGTIFDFDNWTAIIENNFTADIIYVYNNSLIIQNSTGNISLSITTNLGKVNMSIFDVISGIYLNSSMLNTTDEVSANITTGIWGRKVIITHNGVENTSLSPATANSTGYSTINWGFNGLQNFEFTSIPYLNVTYPMNTSYYSQGDPQIPTTINYSSSEATNACWFSIDGGANQSFTCGNSSASLGSLDYGLHNLIIYANNSFGNLGSSNVYFSVKPAPEYSKTFTVPSGASKLVAGAYWQGISSNASCTVSLVNGSNEINEFSVPTFVKNFQTINITLPFIDYTVLMTSGYREMTIDSPTSGLWEFRVEHVNVTKITTEIEVQKIAGATQTTTTTSSTTTSTTTTSTSTTTTSSTTTTLPGSQNSWTVGSGEDSDWSNGAYNGTTIYNNFAQNLQLEHNTVNDSSFETETLGDVNGQDGWTQTYGGLDCEILNNSIYSSVSGAQLMRIMMDSSTSSLTCENKMIDWADGENASVSFWWNLRGGDTNWLNLFLNGHSTGAYQWLRLGPQSGNISWNHGYKNDSGGANTTTNISELPVDSVWHFVELEFHHVDDSTIGANTFSMWWDGVYQGTFGSRGSGNNAHWGWTQSVFYFRVYQLNKNVNWSIDEWRAWHGERYNFTATGNYTTEARDAGSGNEPKNVTVILSDYNQSKANVSIYVDKNDGTFALVKENASNNTTYLVGLNDRNQTYKVRLVVDTTDTSYTPVINRIIVGEAVESNVTVIATAANTGRYYWDYSSFELLFYEATNVNRLFRPIIDVNNDLHFYSTSADSNWETWVDTGVFGSIGASTWDYELMAFYVEVDGSDSFVHMLRNSGEKHYYHRLVINSTSPYIFENVTNTYFWDSSEDIGTDGNPRGGKILQDADGCIWILTDYYRRSYASSDRNSLSMFKENITEGCGDGIWNTESNHTTGYPKYDIFPGDDLGIANGIPMTFDFHSNGVDMQYTAGTSGTLESGFFNATTNTNYSNQILDADIEASNGWRSEWHFSFNDSVYVYFMDDYTNTIDIVAMAFNGTTITNQNYTGLTQTDKIAGFSSTVAGIVDTNAPSGGDFYVFAFGNTNRTTLYYAKSTDLGLNWEPKVEVLNISDRGKTGVYTMTAIYIPETCDIVLSWTESPSPYDTVSVTLNTGNCGGG